MINHSLPDVIVRSDKAGVFAGQIEGRCADQVKLINARRLWLWSGAASISQLSVDGVSNPDGCKFPCEVPSIELFGVIEIVPLSPKARASIDAVPIWRA